jgi:hypothetical protein
MKKRKKTIFSGFSIYPYILGCGALVEETIGLACLWNFCNCFSMRSDSSYNGATLISISIIEPITLIAAAAARASGYLG